jgi:hypothetical protein
VSQHQEKEPDPTSKKAWDELLVAWKRVETLGSSKLEAQNEVSGLRYWEWTHVYIYLVVMQNERSLTSSRFLERHETPWQVQEIQHVGEDPVVERLAEEAEEHEEDPKMGAEVDWKSAWNQDSLWYVLKNSNLVQHCASQIDYERGGTIITGFAVENVGLYNYRRVSIGIELVNR